MQQQLIFWTSLNGCPSRAGAAHAFTLLAIATNDEQRNRGVQ